MPATRRLTPRWIQSLLLVLLTLPQPVAAAGGGAGPVAPLFDLSAHSGAVSRPDLCLTIAVGGPGGSMCGALRLTHALPGTRTYGKARSPVLVYTSTEAEPYVLVPVHVTLPAGADVPSQVTVRLTLAGSRVVEGTWSGAGWSPGTTRRVTLGIDSAGASGVHDFTIQVTNWYSGTPYTSSGSGSYTVVDRRASPFGAGWWLAGLETLDVATMTLVDGNGGVRRYAPTGQPNRWVAPGVDRPDTLVWTDTTYERRLRGNATVVFNASGRHVRTLTPQGLATEFVWGATRLDSIRLPSGTAPQSYAFTYTSSGPSRLTAVTAPGGRVTTIQGTGAVITSILEPGATSARSFAAVGARIVRHVDPQGTITSYGYDAATRRLSRAVADSGGLGITTQVTVAEGRGFGSGSTPAASVALADAYTLLDGPRSVADLTRFWVDRFGAPTKIRNPLGDSTVLYRGNSTFPALVTSVRDPVGYRDSVIYNARGNVTHQIRLNPYGKSPAQNDTTRYFYYADTDTRADYASLIVPPERDTVRMSYLANGNLEWREDRRGSSSRTYFTYLPGTNLLIRVQHPHGGVDSLGYDLERLNLAYHRSAMGFVTTRSTDAIGRETMVVSPIDAAQSNRDTTRTWYNARGLVERTTTSSDSIWYSCPECVGSYGKPAAPQYLQVDYTYDALGNVLTVTRDGTSSDISTSTFAYDALGRKLSEAHTATQGGQSFTYDAAGNLLTWNRYGRQIQHTYDNAGQLVTKSIPEVFYAQEYCTGVSYRNSPCLVDLHFDSLRVPADLQTFYYDKRGNLAKAHNNYARIERSFYPGGALRTDSLWIRTYGSPGLGSGEPEPCVDPNPEMCGPVDPMSLGGFMIESTTSSTHSSFGTAYGLSYRYDRNGRRSMLRYPLGVTATPGDSASYTYHPWGALGTIQGLNVSNDTYSFVYDNSGRLATFTYPNSSAIDSLRYDADDRVIRRKLTGFFNDTLVYDAKGRITRAELRSQNVQTEQWYSGLGHVLASRWKSTVLGDFNVDEYRYDAHGSPLWSKKWDGVQNSPERQHSYASGLLQEITFPVGPNYPTATNSYRDYSASSGDLEYATEVGYVLNQGARSSRPSRYYYSADGKLVAVKQYGRTWNSDGFTTSYDDVITESRYDALGRRITQHIRHRPECSEDCDEAVDRYIWDGSQILVELRSSSTTSEWGTGPKAGRVSYLHGPDIDAPLAVYRAGFGGTTRILPLRNWRGQYAHGLFSGGYPECTPNNLPNCYSVDWPAPKLRTYLDGQGRPRGDWVGSLIHDQRDQSGLLYRRNRYYDSQTGLFTQEDPIGLAGGLNLYGFAGGDPVNFSDPFGLCPEDVGGDGRTASVDDCPQDVQDAWAAEHIHDTSSSGTDIEGMDARLYSAIVRASMAMRAHFGISAGREGGHSVEGRHAVGGGVDINQINFVRLGAMSDAEAKALGNRVGNEIASRLPAFGLRMMYTPGMAVRYNRGMNLDQWRAVLASHRNHVHITINP